MTTPLYLLLTEREILALRLNEVPIRNCQLNDVTIQELTEMFPYLKHTSLSKTFLFKPIASLHLLMNRIEL